VKNKVQAIIMGTCAVFFVAGFVVFAIAQARQSSLRSELRSDGIEVSVESRSFLEQDVRRISPNDATAAGQIYSDDQVLFTFTLRDGTEFTGIQPIAENRYDELGAIDGLTAVYLPGEHESAELLQDGEFVANGVTYWIFAMIAGFLAVGSGASAYLSSRPAKSGPASEPTAPSGA